MRFSLPFFLLAWLAAAAAVAQTPRHGLRETVVIRVSEGTTLGFDLSADGRAIVFDLLGQLWLVRAPGAAARPITDAVHDTADDRDPSFSPDGRRVAFRGERNGRTGLWLLDLDSRIPHQLTQLPDPLGFDGQAAWSPDGRIIAFARAAPDFANQRWRSEVQLFEVASGTLRALAIAGIPNPEVRDPVWVRGGTAIAFVARNARSKAGGRVWMVPAAGGQASPVTKDSVPALAPVFAADGRRMAYFAPDSAGRMQVWVQQLAGDTAAGSPMRVTNHADVTPSRIRWVPDGSALLYSADGRLWKVAASGGRPGEIRFTATLSLTRPRRALPQARFPEPGRQEPARGFTGLALSPDGHSIAVLALGKLWNIPVGGSPRAVADVPLDATALAWSPDGAEVAWSAGVADQEDLFATDLATGASRRVTALPGRETNPAYSPDGHYLAFVHTQKDAVLRVMDAHAGTVADTTQLRNLASIGSDWTSPPQWSPESDALLVSGSAEQNQLGRASLVPLSGQRQALTRFPDAPIFLRWTQQHTIVFVRHDRLWRARFDHTGMLSDPEPLGTAAALYASASRDGALLFVSDSGLRLRTPDGAERRIGWPIAYTPPLAAPLLLRNVRIIDGTGGPMTAPRDIRIERGRIARIAPAGRLATGGAQVVDAAGRVVIPGLMDLHAHTYRPELLPGFLYFGITTLRDQGSSIAPLVAYTDAIAAGLLPGPRVGYGGFQFYSDWPFDEEQGRGIEPEADRDHIGRAVALAEAFGAQHIKTRTFRRWDINARMITEAHRRGMRATGHCAHLLPLVAAGMDAKEHAGLCESRGDTYLYDDLIQLYRAADIGVVPTITYLDFAVRLNEWPGFLEKEAELAPFLPTREHFNWMLALSAANRQRWAQDAERAREAAAKLWRAGVRLGTGTDIWQIPIGVHWELEQLVAAGLPPAQAIHAGTGAAARILGAEKDLGTIAVGKWADLVLLDADPLADIRNTRRIWQVVHYGRLVDRPAILKATGPR